MFVVALLTVALLMGIGLFLRSLIQRKIREEHASGAPEAMVALLPPSCRGLPGRLLFFPTFVLIWLRHRLSQGSYRWWNRVDPTVVLGALPYSKSLVQRLKSTENIRGVINTCDLGEFNGRHLNYKSLGIDQLHLPMPDYTSPSLSQIRSAMKFLEHWSESSSSVYVHVRPSFSVEALASKDSLRKQNQSLTHTHTLAHRISAKLERVEVQRSCLHG